MLGKPILNPYMQPLNYPTLDINKIYTTISGSSLFTHVLLDNRQGIEQPNGSYRTSTSENEVETLSSDLFSVITSACSRGDAFLAEGSEEATVNAFDSYAEAFGQLPEPNNSWHASGWILSRMGECYFRLGSFKQAKELYADLMWRPGTIGNPWIHLRHGQINFELGNLDAAAEELTRALIGGGEEVLQYDDPKYWAFLKTKLNPPPGGWSDEPSNSEDPVDRLVARLQKYCADNKVRLTDDNYDEMLRKAVTPAEYALCNIPEGLHDKLTALCAKGDTCAKRGDFKAALKHYWKAWDALPDPKTDYEAALWILAAVGDANFLSGDFEAGRDNIFRAMSCLTPDAIDNPFLHLRLGQCQFELGNLDAAAEELTRALMGGGEEVLQYDDPKYWAFLKTKLNPPPGGWSDEPSNEKRPWWKIW